MDGPQGISIDCKQRILKSRSSQHRGQRDTESFPGYTIDLIEQKSEINTHRGQKKLFYTKLDKDPKYLKYVLSIETLRYLLAMAPRLCIYVLSTART